jgi:hypothetical protein
MMEIAPVEETNAENAQARYLNLTPEDYLKERVDDQIEWLNAKSIYNQKRFKQLRKVEIIAAALIPFLTALSAANSITGTTANAFNLGAAGTIIVGLLGITITIIAGFMSLEQYQKNWIEYRVLAESLKREKFLFCAKTEPYNTAVTAFPIFVQRIEALTARENTSWSENMQTPTPKTDGKK